MNKYNLVFIGVDVDDKCFSGCVMTKNSNRINEFRSKPNLGALVKKIEKLCYDKNLIKICYEAGYLGYSLQRDLNNKGYHCDIVAPSLTPKQPGSKVKTNRIDAKKLTKYYMNDLLTIVTPPSKEDESARDFLRSRKFVVDEVKRKKLHVQSICRRMGLNYREETHNPKADYWTVAHRKWLDKTINKIRDEYLKFNLTLLLNQLEQLESSLKNYNDKVVNLSEDPKYKLSVHALCCFRGIDTLTALTFIFAMGDISRFSHPKKITSYAGLDLIEYSSGDNEYKYCISKMGNKYLRTGAVEACQLVTRAPRISKRLKEKRKGVHPDLIKIADKCMNRLYKKSMKLMFTRKGHNKIKTACARELLCFVWEVLTKVKNGNFILSSPQI